MAINATNLHVGGGVQVAVSFIAELSRWRDVAGALEVWVSTEVDGDLGQVGVDRAVFHAYHVCDNFGIRQLWGGFNKVLRGYDAVFTVFGPLYAVGNRFKSIVGFAQPWIAYPRNEAYSLLGMVAQWRTRLKFFAQGWFYRRADLLVVELPHVLERLRALGWTNGVDVVSNCISNVYRDPSCWRPVTMPPTTGLKLGIVSRDYVHKNLGILPIVKDILHHKFALTVNFLVTLTDDEWQARSDEFRSEVINVGALSVAQCPSFYKQIDGVVFPSLLECFSATPIEALAMGLPLFASDRGFVRDICGDAARYFDPTDPESIAESISSYFYSPTPITCSGELAIRYTDPSVRAQRYVEILSEMAGGLGAPAANPIA